MSLPNLLPLITFFDVSAQDGSQLLDCLIQTGVYDPQSRTIIHHHHRLWSDILSILAGHKTINETLRLGTDEGRPLILSQHHHTKHTSPHMHQYLLTFGPQQTNNILLFSSSYARVYAPA
ncbi:MAG: hypothetical protein NZL83_00625 [Candidatus Absconditabacterales bacterium]|nr:hypothetical protein [Candidatus Absconditabacterales bacterium]